MIIPRRLQAPIADHYEPDVHWQLELYDPTRQHYYPVGIAFITAFRHQVNLDAIFVFDQFRRQGLGRQLLRACRYHWPGILLTAQVAEFAAHVDSKIEPRIPSQARFACGEGRRPQ